MKGIITTLAAVFIAFTTVIGHSSNKPVINTNCSGIITVQYKSQDTLKPGHEYDLNVKIPVTYKHNFTITVSGGKIRGANSNIGKWQHSYL